MERNEVARSYADAVNRLSRSWLEAGSALFAANRRLAETWAGAWASAAGPASAAWVNEARAAEEVLARAVRRSGEEARAVLDAADGFADVAFPARSLDLARAQAFLWTVAGLAVGERFERAASGPTIPAASALSPRFLVLGVVAADLWFGYAALRERARWLPGTVRDEDWELQHRRGAGRVLDAARALGGALIKAAQFASSRPDILPAAYVEDLAELQDRVPPRPWSVIEGAVAREIGRPVGEVFDEFDPEPIASASIAQVHRARLADGREVAVKVQYPGIGDLIEADLAALEGIFGAVSRLEPVIDLGPILSYLRWTLPMELDFRREAGAIKDLGEALGHRNDIVVPEVVEGLNTGRLLVMELVEGVKITDRKGLAEAGIEAEAVAEKLVDVYAEQLFARGVFHADPHPGNLLVQRGEDGPVLVLLDHGLTLRVPPELVAAMKGAIVALSEGDFDALTDALRKAGLNIDPNLSLETLLGVVGVLLGGDRSGDTDGEDEGNDITSFALELGSSIGHIPNDLLLVGRALGLIDGINRQLAPDLDAVEIVARYAQEA